MRRRDFLLASVVLPSMRGNASAQTTAVRKRIAIVSPAAKVEYTKADPDTRVFLDELKRLGFGVGENLIVDYYSAEGRLANVTSRSLAR